jgi:cell division protein FtsQ
MLKKVKKIAIIISALSAVIFLISSVSISKSNRTLKGININILDTALFFIKKEDTQQLLLDMGYDSGTVVQDINIANVERILSNTPFVKTVNVYIDISGNLCVNLKQRKPILRFFTKNKRSYYITEDRYVMHTSRNYSSRVPIITCDYNFNMTSGADTIDLDSKVMELFELGQFLRSTPFWEAQIAQIDINNGLATCIPQVGNHIIKLGPLKDLEKKFEKLEVFYQQGLPKTGWNEYSEINLQYEGQIICNKN